MASRNYEKGRDREYRVLYGILKQSSTLKGARFYGSKGITDVWWLKKDGTFCEAQVKAGTMPGKKAYISLDESTRLRKYAVNYPFIKVYLVMCDFGKKPWWRKIE